MITPDDSEYLRYLASYLAQEVELYGQQGQLLTPYEFFLELLKKFEETLP